MTITDRILRYCRYINPKAKHLNPPREWVFMGSVGQYLTAVGSIMSSAGSQFCANSQPGKILPVLCTCRLKDEKDGGPNLSVLELASYL